MGEALRILLLEESPLDAELNIRALKQAGLAFESLRVETGPAFEEALRTFRPDVVLADYNLPGYQGAAALEAARKQQPDLPFIFVTGALGEEKAVELLRQGADDYILKDRLQRLPQALQRALEYARGKRELHLEELVESRTAELRAAREDAERLARVKSDFLANMSHEIRTPLNAILGFAQIGLRDSLGRKTRDTFRRILDSGELLQGVVNDILDFSKLEAGKLRIEQGVIELREIMDRIADLMRGRNDGEGPELRLELAPDLPASCRGDSLRLSQVLMNLLSNAVKFTERGRIVLSAARAGERLLFRVQDTGIGMGPEEVARLFTPFEQGDGSISRRYGGTGLGLSISKRLLDLMGGGIAVQSAPGRGSTFEVRLPLEDPRGLLSQSAAPGADTPGAGSGRLRLAGLSILVAEDNAVNRLLLEDMLRGEGCRLDQVANGRLALERVERMGADHYDLVLMDVQMPEMDGYEATRSIHAVAPRLPVLGLTAHALAEERERCLAAGMVEHVVKPVALGELLAAIGRHAKLPAGDAPPSASAPAAAEAEAASRLPVPLPDTRDLVNWKALERQFRGREAFLRRLLSTLLSSHAGKAGLLRELAGKRDFDQLEFQAHSLKGTASGVMPEAVRQLAERAERAVLDGDPEAADHALQLAAGVEALVEEVQSYLHAKEAEAAIGRREAPRVDRDRLRALLDELEQLLVTDDTRATTLFCSERPLLRAALGEPVDQLGRQIEQFDFEAAAATLRRLTQRLPEEAQ